MKVKNGILIDKDVILSEDIKDTISRKSDYFGFLQYISHFDTVKLKDKNDFRDIFFYVRISKDTTKTFKEFTTMKCDTFVRIDDEDMIIPLFEIKLDTIPKGSYYLDGYVIDKLHTKYNNEKTRIRTLETKIIHPIYIAD